MVVQIFHARSTCHFRIPHSILRYRRRIRIVNRPVAATNFAILPRRPKDHGAALRFCLPGENCQIRVGWLAQAVGGRRQGEYERWLCSGGLRVAETQPTTNGPQAEKSKP